jgi:hypothetical protein
MVICHRKKQLEDYISSDNMGRDPVRKILPTDHTFYPNFNRQRQLLSSFDCQLKHDERINLKMFTFQELTQKFV